MKTTKKKLAAIELSRKGGKAAFKKYGREHYQKMAAARWGTKKKTAK